MRFHDNKMEFYHMDNNNNKTQEQIQLKLKD